jgi:hypothetical protein
MSDYIALMLAERQAIEIAHPRSVHWHDVRALHLRREPSCVACGNNANLNVHHCIPYHVDPKLELDDGDYDDNKTLIRIGNLITLCEHPLYPCHFIIGHAGPGGGWKGWNEHVREDAALYRIRVSRARELAYNHPVPTVDTSGIKTT